MIRRTFGFIGTTLGLAGILLFGSGCPKEDEEAPIPPTPYTPTARNIVTSENTPVSPLEFLAIKPGTNKNTRVVFVTEIDTANSKVKYEVRENNVAVVEKTSDYNPNTGVGVFDLGNYITASYRVNATAGTLQGDINKDGDITADSLDNHITIEGIAVPLNGSFQLQPRTDLTTYFERSEVPFPIVYTFVGLSADKSAIVVKDDSDALTEFDLATGLIITYEGQHPFSVVDTPDGPRLYVDLNADGDKGMDPLEGQPFITEEQVEIREGHLMYIGDVANPTQFPLAYRLKKINTLALDGTNDLEFVDPNGLTVVVPYDISGQGTLKDVNNLDHIIMLNTTQGYIFVDLDGSGLVEQGRDLAVNNTNITAPRVSDESTIVQNSGYTFTKIALGVPRLVIYSRDTATPPNHTMTDQNGAQPLTFATVDGALVATYTNPDGAQIKVEDQGAGITGDWNANNRIQDTSNVVRR
ncbi:MAG: hypothetical protein KAT43_03280 [Nanoarchaeota archaeon]|nr:hypothetical protein [Nanoarchaeota archaeon]